MNDSIDLLDDEALLRRYAEAEDREALELLFRRHVNAAYATALRVCRNAADAEDVVQAAYVQVMRNASACRGDHGVRMWILQIVANVGKKKIRTEVRRRHREETVAEDQDGFFVPDGPEGPDADLRDKEHEVLAALDTLPERFRSAIWLHLCQGMSRTDAAAALGLPERTLDNQIQYGMKKLRQTLATRGTSASLASLATVLPLLTGEPAPASLVDCIGEVAHASLETLGTGAPSSMSTGSGGLFVKVAAAVILVATGVGVAYFRGRDETPPPVMPASTRIPVRNDIRYVPGRVLFEDHFTNGLANWTVLKAPRKPSNALYEPAGDAEKKCIQVGEALRDGKLAPCLIIQVNAGSPFKLGLRLKEKIQAPAYVIEWLLSSDISGVSISSIYPGADLNYRVLYHKTGDVLPKTWFPYRSELTPFSDVGITNGMLANNFINNTLDLRLVVQFDTGTVMISPSDGRVLIGEVIIRELVPEPL